MNAFHIAALGSGEMYEGKRRSTKVFEYFMQRPDILECLQSKTDIGKKAADLVLDKIKQIIDANSLPDCGPYRADFGRSSVKKTDTSGYEEVLGLLLQKEAAALKEQVAANEKV